MYTSASLPMSKVLSSDSRTSSAVPAGQHCIQALRMVTIRREFLHFPSGVLPLLRHSFRASIPLSLHPSDFRRSIRLSLFLRPVLSLVLIDLSVFTRADFTNTYPTVYLPYHPYLAIIIPSFSLANPLPPLNQTLKTPYSHPPMPPPSPSTHAHGSALVTGAITEPLPSRPPPARRCHGNLPTTPI